METINKISKGNNRLQTLKKNIKKINFQLNTLLSLNSKKKMDEKRFFSLVETLPITQQTLLQKITSKFSKWELDNRYSPINEIRVILAKPNGTFTPDSLQIIDFLENTFNNIKKQNWFISKWEQNINDKLNLYSPKEQQAIRNEVEKFFKEDKNTHSQ